MDEILIKVSNLEDYDYIVNYFHDKDIISLKDILDALDYELEKNALIDELEQKGYVEEEKLNHFRRNYETMD